MEAHFAKTIVSVVNSPNFDKQQILAEKIKLSQAFCLLWLDAKSGDVCGRRCCDVSNAGALAAALVDLAALDKIEFLTSSSLCKCKGDTTLVKVKDAKPTGSFLDAAIFDKILAHHHENPDKLTPLKDWIKKYKCEAGTIALDSMVEQGILGMEEEKCGTRTYTTLKPEKGENLKNDVRAVAIEGAKPGAFTHALVILARFTDYQNCLGAPILQKHFSSQEYSKAKQDLDALIKESDKH